MPKWLQKWSKWGRKGAEMPSRAACRRLWKALGALLGCRWPLETLPGRSWAASGGLLGRSWAAPGSVFALGGGARRPPGQLLADFFGHLGEICVADPWEGRKCIKKRSCAAWDASVFERVVVASLGAFWHHGRTDGHGKKARIPSEGRRFLHGREGQQAPHTKPKNRRKS